MPYLAIWYHSSSKTDNESDRQVRIEVSSLTSLSSKILLLSKFYFCYCMEKQECQDLVKFRHDSVLLNLKLFKYNKNQWNVSSTKSPSMKSKIGEDYERKLDRISCRNCSSFVVEFIENVTSDESKIGFNLLVIKGEIKDYCHVALYRCLRCNSVSEYSVIQ